MCGFCTDVPQWLDFVSVGPSHNTIQSVLRDGLHKMEGERVDGKKVENKSVQRVIRDRREIGRAHV